MTLLLAGLFALACFLVACGFALGWWLRGDEVDGARWSGYCDALKALDGIYSGRVR